MTPTMKSFRSIAVVLCAAVLASCEGDGFQDPTGPAPSARVRFFNFGVNAPGVNFYADDTKMTAILSATGTESTTGIVYGGVGAAGLYSAIDPGQYTLSGRIAAATDKDLPISNIPATIEDGKHYSFYQSGFYDATAKTVDGFVVEDPLIPGFDYSVAYVRFVNAISNANPMTLYVTHTVSLVQTAVGGDVAYKAAGAFTAVPEGFYDLATRYPGSGTNVIVRAGVSFVGGRIYTISSRGDITVVSTTATNRPFLDNTANR
jgi:hypothetical protein